MSLRALIAETRKEFQSLGIPTVDVELLLAHVLGIERMQLHAREYQLSAEQKTEFENLVTDRRQGIPTQYLIGKAPFRKLEFEVGPGVLIPRPETELLVGAALSEIAVRNCATSVIDLGSGSGAIAISVAWESREMGVPVTVIAVEREQAAIPWLTRNVSLHQVDVRVVNADVRNALVDVRADIVVANPPYIPDGAPIPTLVAEHEPASALYGGGGEGLELPRLFIEAATRLLKPSGLLIMEHYESQRPALESFLSRDYLDVAGFPDLNGRDRMITARRRG